MLGAEFEVLGDFIALVEVEADQLSLHRLEG